jgi:hypothetical protein
MFDFHQGVRDLALLHSFQTDSVVHSASYQTGTWGFSSGVKPPEREADHSIPSSAKVKIGDDILPLFHAPSWHGL